LIVSSIPEMYQIGANDGRDGEQPTSSELSSATPRADIPQQILGRQ
jgi:hypothetical protein